MVMGLTMFVMFAYKASNEVSSPNIAAGSQRQQTLVAISSDIGLIGGDRLSGAQGVTVVMPTHSNNDSKKPAISIKAESSRDNKGHNSRGRQGSSRDEMVTIVVNGKNKAN